MGDSKNHSLVSVILDRENSVIAIGVTDSNHPMSAAKLIVSRTLSLINNNETRKSLLFRYISDNKEAVEALQPEDFMVSTVYCDTVSANRKHNIVLDSLLVSGWTVLTPNKKSEIPATR